jgi:hypothetical protein
MSGRTAGAVEQALRGVEVVTRAPAHLFGIRANVGLGVLHTYPRQTLPIVTSALRRLGVTPAACPVCLIRPRTDGTFDMTAAYPTAEPVRIGSPFVVTGLPACRAAQALHAGSWNTLLFSYDRLNEWLAAHGVTAVPSMWEEYLVGPGQLDDQTQWRTRLVVPLPAEATDRE